MKYNLHKLIKIIILIIEVCHGVNAACCHGRYGKSYYGWGDYAIPSKPQTINVCWIYASTEYVQLVYNSKYKIAYNLAPEQINKDIENFCAGTTTCDGTKGTNGGYIQNALNYMNGRGIMTDFMYALLGKYNKNYITPIKVGNAERICYNNYTCILAHLKETPLLVSMYSSDITYFENDYTASNYSNHVVVLTDVCEYKSNLYVEYLNTWGVAWGECNGMGYLRITFEDGTKIYNNRGIFSQVFFANVSDWRETQIFNDTNILKSLIICAYIIFGLLICSIIIVILAIIISIQKKNIQGSQQLQLQQQFPQRLQKLVINQ